MRIWPRYWDVAVLEATLSPTDALSAPDGLAVESDSNEPDLLILSFPVRERAEFSALLTSAESEVLMSLRSGLTNAQIANRRGVSVRTVANQLASLFRKLGVSSRLDAAIAASNLAQIG